MPRVGSDGRVTVVVKDHYLKKLMFISQQDCVAGARICSPTRMTKRPGQQGNLGGTRIAANIAKLPELLTYAKSRGRID